jgi:tetratricopeptide (TPR) repeat protein
MNVPAVVLGLLLAFAQAEKVDDHLRLAQVHIDQEQFEPAISELEHALALRSDIKGAYYQLGYAYWKLHRYADARKAFERELTFEPPDPYSLYYLGRISGADGRHRDAIRYFQKVAAISAILDVHQRLGSAYLQLGDLARAIQNYERAVKLHPKRGDAHYQLARAYQRAGRQAEARRELEITRKLKGEHQEQIRDLVECDRLLNQKQYAEALALARKLAEVQDPDLLISVGSLIGRYGHHRQAFEYLEQSAWLAPSFEAHFNIAVTLVALKDLPRATEALREAVRLKPESYEAHSLLGTLLSQQGSDEESIIHLRKAVEMRADNPRLLALLGLKYTEHRYYADALEVLRKAIALQPDDPELRFLLIQAHYMNQDSEQALEEARKAASDFPAVAKSHLVLALQLHNQGRYEEARPCLEKAQAIDPNLDEAHAALGDVLLRQGEIEQGLAYLRTAAERRPDLVEPHIGLGKALLQLKRYDEVIRAMEHAIRLHPDQAQPHLYLSQAYRAVGRLADAKRASETFSALNRKRMERRDREGERRHVRQ